MSVASPSKKECPSWLPSLLYGESTTWNPSTKASVARPAWIRSDPKAARRVYARWWRSRVDEEFAAAGGDWNLLEDGNPLEEVLQRVMFRDAEATAEAALRVVISETAHRVGSAQELETCLATRAELLSKGAPPEWALAWAFSSGARG